MGVTSAGPQETVGLGEENVSDLEVDLDGVANNSDNLTGTRDESILHHVSDSGAGRSSKGYGRATLLGCLERLGEQRNPVNPATCASGENNIGNMPQTDLRQVPPED